MRKSEVSLGLRVYRGDCAALGGSNRDDRRRWGEVVSQPFFYGSNWFVKVKLDTGVTVDAPLHRLKVVGGADAVG